MTRYLVLLMASAPLALAAGCGSDDKSAAPSPTVAKVGNTVISQDAVMRVQPLVAPNVSTDESGRASCRERVSSVV